MRSTSSASSSTAVNTLNCAEPRIKIVSIGSSGVGKSCVIKRYCEGRFVSKYIPTIGIDYGVKRVNVSSSAQMSSSAPNLVVRVNFWDMAGGDEYIEVRNEFYAAAEGVVLVYDVTSAPSFAALDGWVKEMETHMNTRRPSGGHATLSRLGAKAPVVVVCANKVDDEVDGGRRRVVSETEGRQWATKHGYGYFETSACTGVQVAEMFNALFKDVVAAFM